MARKPLTACCGCGRSSPPVATGSPRDRAARAVALAVQQGWAYERGWYCKECVAAMSSERRAKAQRRPTEAQGIVLKRLRHRPLDVEKSPLLRPLNASTASDGRPWPKEFDFEDKRQAAKRKLEELRSREGGAPLPQGTQPEPDAPAPEDYLWPWESAFEAKRLEAKRKLDELRMGERSDLEGLHPTSPVDPDDEPGGSS